MSQGHSFGKEVWFKSNHQWKRKSEERVRKLGADIFVDYRKEDYSLVLKDVDYVLDTLGERELYKEFSILKKGGKLVSLRALPNREFAVRIGMPIIKRILFSAAGSKYNRMAGEKGQKYYFIFVHENGGGLEKISFLFKETHLEVSIDDVFGLKEVNKSLTKVASGVYKGKTVLRVF